MDKYARRRRRKFRSKYRRYLRWLMEDTIENTCVEAVETGDDCVRAAKAATIAMKDFMSNDFEWYAMCGLPNLAWMFASCDLHPKHAKTMTRSGTDQLLYGQPTLMEVKHETTNWQGTRSR